MWMKLVHLRLLNDYDVAVSNIDTDGSIRLQSTALMLGYVFHLTFVSNTHTKTGINDSLV